MKKEVKVIKKENNASPIKLTTDYSGFVERCEKDLDLFGAYVDLLIQKLPGVRTWTIEDNRLYSYFLRPIIPVLVNRLFSKVDRLVVQKIIDHGFPLRYITEFDYLLFDSDHILRVKEACSKLGPEDGPSFKIYLWYYHAMFFGSDSEMRDQARQLIDEIHPPASYYAQDPEIFGKEVGNNLEYAFRLLGEIEAYLRPRDPELISEFHKVFFDNFKLDDSSLSRFLKTEPVNVENFNVALQFLDADASDWLMDYVYNGLISLKQDNLKREELRKILFQWVYKFEDDPHRYKNLIKVIRKANLPPDIFYDPQEVPYLFNQTSFDPLSDIPASEASAIRSLGKNLKMKLIRGNDYKVVDGHVVLFRLKNDTKSIPDDLAKLSMVQEICFILMYLAEFPPAIRSLKHLKKLDIHECKIETIPEWIGELAELEAFTIGGQSLRSIPESLVNLPRLKHLNIMEFSEDFVFPASTAHLTNLEYFYIHFYNDPILVQLIRNKGAPILGLEPAWIIIQDPEADILEEMLKIYQKRYFKNKKDSYEFWQNTTRELDNMKEYS